MSKIKVDEVEISETPYGIQVDAYKEGEVIPSVMLGNVPEAMLYIEKEFEFPDESE